MYHSEYIASTHFTAVYMRVVRLLYFAGTMCVFGAVSYVTVYFRGVVLKFDASRPLGKVVHR